MFSIFLIIDKSFDFNHTEILINSVIIQTFNKWELFISTDSYDIFNFINNNFKFDNIKIFFHLNDYNVLKKMSKYNFLSLYDTNSIWNSDKLNFESKLLLKFDFLIYNKVLDKINNDEYKEIESKLKNCIKSCHNYLYSNGSIVGNEASNDIILLFI